MDANELQIPLLITIFVGALPLIIIGYLISVKGKRHWINGVDQSKLADPEGFGRYVGNSIIATGCAIFLVAFLTYLQIINIIAFAATIFVVSFLPLPALYIAKSRYS
ncbi:MAG: hypothetical protein GJ680_12195 [Alteromonadaceae bacterium]|nr:hypothetical protein [Alteromonadaceae bacterium]